MAKLIYTAITSLDGYIEDRNGNFDWAMPDEEVHGYVNNLERGNGTFLLGRRMYQTMAVWEEIHVQSGHPEVMRDYAAIWHGGDKVVYSGTLDHATTERTRIERVFDPENVRRMKADSATDLSVGGAQLAGVALRAGLVDEIHLLISPVLVGGGKPALPEIDATRLELLGQRGFGNGVVHLHYAVRNS
ncbi:Dihydrofolate reductase [Arthrobacter alpinus]|uniref:Dihydrofolate reductase n=1 Tax=Arthrobacter alpinus TaxID=656366 RepID=A0A1H5N9F2_9MICC|nr:dihydrofolate reductase family protein [Arthrobacter alpinus]SEE98289.1 Dihydrofolate reductase [Arthrobacter alpinus]